MVRRQGNGYQGMRQETLHALTLLLVWSGDDAVSAKCQIEATSRVKPRPPSVQA